MIAVTQYEGETVAVLGLGRSGLAAARALDAGGARVIAWDDNPARRDDGADAGIVIADPRTPVWEAVNAVVPSPGIAPVHAALTAARARDIDIVGDIGLFRNALKDKQRRTRHDTVSGAGPSVHPAPFARLVAITGTNGKSTTTALVTHILRCAGLPVEMGGNIGVPALQLSPPAPDLVYVLEVSSFQLETAGDLAPDVAVLLNVSPDHLDRHHTMDAYASLKARIFAGQEQGSTAIIGVDDPHGYALFEQLKTRTGVRLVPVSMGRAMTGGVYVRDGVLFDAVDTPPRAVADLKTAFALPGSHNWQNAAAAYGVSRALGVGDATVVRAFADFPGLPHRMETVAEAEGVRFVNDSKATNAEATARALACYERVFWIAGGVRKHGDLDLLNMPFNNVIQAYLIGEAAADFACLLRGRVVCTQYDSLADATAAAVSGALADVRTGKGGGVVLLSPACASLDQFSNFEERGETFRVTVLETLKATTAPDGGRTPSW